MSVYVRAVFAFHIFYILYIFVRGAGLRTMFLVTSLATVVLFHQSYLLGVTFRTIPLLMYAAAYLLIRPRSTGFRPRDLDWLVALMIAAAMLSTVGAAERFRAVTGLALLLCAAALYFVGRRSPRTIRRAVWRFFTAQYAVAALLFAGFAFILRGWDVLQSPMQVHLIGGYNVNSVGSAMAFGLPAAAYMALTERGWRRMPGLVSIFAAAFVIYFCQARSAALSGALSIALLLAGRLVVRPDARFFPHRRGIAAAAAGVGALAAAGLIWLNQSLQFVDLQTFYIRLDIWSLFIRRTLTYAPLLGFGPENLQINAYLPIEGLAPETLAEYRGFINAFGPDLHAHNHALMLLFFYGLAGFAIYACLLAAVARIGVQMFQRGMSDEALALLAILCGLFISGLLEYTLWEANTLLPAMLWLGFFRRLASGKATPHRSAPARFFFGASKSVFWLSLGLFSFVAYNFSFYVQKNRLLRPYISFSVFNYVQVHPETPPTIAAAALSLSGWPHRSLFLALDEQLSGELELRAGDPQSPETLQRALQRFNNCIALNEWSPYCRLRAADLYEQLGDKDNAVIMRETARRRDPHGLLERSYAPNN
jgi:O-antigen ligase